MLRRRRAKPRADLMSANAAVDGERLIADGGLPPNAVHEITREVSPIVPMRRAATQQVEVAGQRIAESEKVVMCYGAANHDPAVFPEPERARSVCSGTPAGSSERSVTPPPTPTNTGVRAGSVTPPAGSPPAARPATGRRAWKCRPAGPLRPPPPCAGYGA